MGDNVRKLPGGAVTFLLIGIIMIFSLFYFGGVTPGGMFGVELLIGIMLIIWFTTICKRQEISVRIGALLLPMILFALIAFISRFYAIYPYASKVVFLQWLSYALLYYVVTQYLGRKEHQNFIRVILYCACAISLFGLYAFLFKRYDLLLHYKEF